MRDAALILLLIFGLLLIGLPSMCVFGTIANPGPWVNWQDAVIVSLPFILLGVVAVWSANKKLSKKNY